jgi:uncharacterized protein (TIGR01777 family)
VSKSVACKKFVIAGGSGFVGLSLAHHLAGHGASVVILSRNAPKKEGPWQHLSWDARTLGPWREALNEADGLVNLAGRSVNCVKTPDRQDEILRSRVESTRVLGQALRQTDAPPPVWVQMSTAHIYGDPPRVTCSEESATGCGFAPFIGRAWEEAFQASVLSTQRAVILRTGFVLGRDRGSGAGAMDTLTTLATWGLGGKVGHGTQGMSWIHETDLNRIIERGLTNSGMQGIYNASAPNPVSQVEFMRELRRALGMPIGLPASAWMVRMGARHLLRTDPELALYGRYVLPKRLTEEGFRFQLPELRQSLLELQRSDGHLARPT